MAIDDDTLAKILALATSCEDVARQSLALAQAQLKAKTLTSDDFDQAYQDYGVSMQKARDMYYQASHDLTQQVASSADLKTLTDQTSALGNKLKTLSTTESALAISFGALTFIAAVAVAVTAPSPASVGAAVTAAASLVTTIGGT